LGLFFPIYGKITNVPNHQAVLVVTCMIYRFNKTPPFTSKGMAGTPQDELLAKS
jgi:hypothetical protein